MEAWRREGMLMKMMQRGLGEEGNKVVELQGKKNGAREDEKGDRKSGGGRWGEEGKDGKTERRGSSSACRFPLWPLS